MKLASLREYGELCYTPESCPTMTTLRRKANAGEIPHAVRQGSRWYVDLDKLKDEENTAAAYLRKILVP